MKTYTKGFLNKTIQVWQPYSPTPLSLKDAREITENMTALFNFLISEDKKPSNNKAINTNRFIQSKIRKEVKANTER